MKKNQTRVTGLVAIILLVCGLYCWFVPLHTTDFTSHGPENPIVAAPNVKVYENILFPIGSSNQKVFVSLATSEGGFNLVMLTQENLQSYQQNESYAALFEAMNVTSISETVNLTEPVTEWITIVLFSTVSELNVEGGVGIQYDVYYQWLALLFVGLAIVSFVVIVISSTWEGTKKDSTHK